ncbi:MAG: DUF2167 domain-containing protein [Chitinophagaceae bacterium]|nr:DUF2167 domain-containing protein [Chitinophagaceae bacterium]
MKKIIIVFLCFVLPVTLLAGKDGDTSTLDAKKLIDYVRLMDSVKKVMKYQTGVVVLDNGIAQLNIPAGFKFLNKEQSKYVIADLWGNPPREDVLGMIFPDNDDPFSDSSYAFIVSYDAMGYVKDGDADKINYDDMLKEMQKSEKEENAERIKNGYGSIHFVGWAQKPFYDKSKKVLHWAKELKFSDAENNTLNYEVRILGRKGVLSLNAVASMSELAMVNKDIDKVLGMAAFTKGNTYEEFDSNVDEVAAWTIGGLVAGKVLAKAGFLALILKNIKLVVLGIIAFGGAVWRFITGRKKKEEEQQEPTA